MATTGSESFSEECAATWAALAQGGPRLAGSREEARAADALFQRLQTLGFLTQRQRFETPAGLPLLLFVHVVLGIMGALLSAFWPGLAWLLLSFVLLSLFGELTGRYHWLWASLAKHESQNVIAQWKPEAATRSLLLVAALDTGRSARLTRPDWQRSAKAGPIILGPALVFFLLLAPLWFFVGAVACGAGGWLLFIAICLLCIGLFALAVFLGEWAWGDERALARDNRAGLALFMGLAREVAETRPEDTEFCFIALGAGLANRAGAFHYLRELGGLYAPETTRVVVLDDLGGEGLGVVVREGTLWPNPYPEQEALVTARKLLRDDPSFADLKRLTRQGQTDAGPFARAGFQALTLSSQGLADFAPGLGGQALGETLDSKKIECSRAFIWALARA